MTGNLRWHSCSTDDFPLKRHKVSKACETCRAKKMRCDGKNPCQRCESNKIKCIYNDKPVRSRSRIPTTTTKSPVKNLRISTNTSSIADTPSPSPSTVTSLPSPMPEVKINSDCLKKITFVNELYETLRLQQSSKTRRYGTSMPPLLLDFFNTTSQPQTIWTCFSLCLHRFCDSSNNNSHFMRDAPENESNELVKETFRVFVTHNLLYGAFIDTELLLFVLDSVSMFSYMQQSSSSPTAVTTDDLMANMTTTKQDTTSSLPHYSIVIYCILAITFQSAYQSLPNMNENFTNSLYIYSHIFYREAHKRFLSICFSTIPAQPVTTTKTKGKDDDESETRRNIIMLVQASVLLTHFQCTAISEEQAYMTIKIGLNLVQQHGLTTLYDDNEVQEDDDDKESLFVLLKSLDAWYVWLAFYLQKPYSTIELDISHISSTQLQEQQQQHLFLKKNKDQKWAILITDAFTCFLKNILKSKQAEEPMNIYTVKESLKYLNNTITNHDNDEDFIPSHIISLYHDILTVQLYTCQLDDHFSLLHNNNNDDSEDNTNVHEHTAMEVCILASQNILTTVNKVIFVEYNNTNATAPLKYIPLSIIYSVCLISQINLYLTNHGYNKKKLASFVKEIDYLQSSLDKMLKIASPYFEAFQIIYSKFNSGNVQQQKLVSPSPSSLSTSSSTTTATTTQTVSNHHTANHSKTTVNNTPIPSEAQHYLSHASNSNDMFMTDSQHFTASMNLPLTTTGGVIRSRADIDREQLDKLSHNKSSSAHHQHHQLQQQQQLLQQQFLLQKQQQQQLNQLQFQQQPSNSNFYLQKYMQPTTTTKRHMNGYNSQQQQLNDQQMYYCNTNGGKQQKRSYQQQLYEQFGYMTPQHQQQQQIKRHRSSTATSFDEFTAAAAAAAAASGHHKSHSMVVDEEGHSTQHHERSKSVTTTATTGFMDLESNNDPTFMYNMWMLEGAAAAATQGEELYDARHHRHQSGALNSAYLQQQQQQQQQQQDNSLTKLPLPQPSKQASMVTKWSAPAPTQTWSKFFFESEVQTLHFQTPPLIHFESNNTFPMVGLNVIQEEGVDDTQSSQQQQQANGNNTNNSESFMYPTHHHHRASIISDHSSASSSICSAAGGGGANIITPTTTATAAVAATSSQGSNEEIGAEAAAVAAAAAVWASTAAAVAANNAAFTTNKQQPSGTPTPTTTTGHWINSEKVGDEEFWGE